MNIETPGFSRPKKHTLLLAGAAVIAFSAATIAFTVSALRSAQPDHPVAADTLTAYGAVVDFSLTERSGLDVTLRDLRGTVWIADFIFTHCAGPCPLMTARMAELQKALRDIPAVRLVSFSVDPERDTPEVLSAYADEYGADPDRWWFLTGDIETIARVAVDGFHVGSRDDPILHSTRFALVDMSGLIRGYYQSDDPLMLDTIRRDVQALLDRERT